MLAIPELNEVNSRNCNNCGCDFTPGLCGSPQAYCSAKCRYACRDKLRKSTRHPLIQAWKSMKARCYNTKNKYYAIYGGRGISVCDRWRHSFSAFCADMGEKPDKSYAIDRINNDGNYDPSNCRWATAKQQSENKSSNRLIEYLGKRQCMSKWAEEVGISRFTLKSRLSSGWSIERALTAPITPKNGRRH